MAYTDKQYEDDTKAMQKIINMQGEATTGKYNQIQDALNQIDPRIGIYRPSSNGNIVPNVEASKKIAQKSTGQRIKPTKKSNRKRVETNVKDLNIILDKVAPILLAATIAIGGFVAVSNGYEQITGIYAEQTNYTKCIDILETDARLNLLSNGLAITDSKTGKIIIGNNSVEDYKKLNINELVDIYVYYRVLPTQELNKLIQSTTYTDKFGTYYYLDAIQFLKINGYWDYTNDQPLWNVFENYMEAEIKENQDEIINRIGIPYTVDNEAPKSRGGR